MMQKIAETQTSAFKTVVQGSTIFFVLKDGAKNGKMSKQEKKDQMHINKIIAKFID